MTKSKKYPLDDYEQEILGRYESGTMEQGKLSESLIVAAREIIKKNKKINIHIRIRLSSEV